MSNLNHIFFHSVENVRHDSLLRYGTGATARSYSSEDFRQAVFALCRYFHVSGLNPGDRVAVLSENRPEWHIADFAILLSGLVSVPLYPSFSPAQIRYTLEHSGAAALLVSREQLWKPIASSSPPNLVPLEDWDTPIGTSLPTIIREAKPDSSFLEKLKQDGLALDADTLATIVYTSGTTGVPKGVMLTHRNIASNLQECIRRLAFRAVPRALTVLPLAHVFERMLCYGYFQMGIPIAYGDPHDLPKLFPAHQPVVMGCVPRILEKIRENVFEQILAQPAHRQAIARALLKVGHAHIGEGVLHRRPKLSSRLFYGLAQLLVYRKLHRKLGGNLRFVICGGARLAPDVEEFFLAAGIQVLQGYGLTETSPVISLDPFGAAKTGAAGRPLDNLEVAFAGDGEILVRGPSVFRGYFGDPVQTAAALQDGWFQTGDRGSLDADGYLVISGRKKEMLVTSGGKNVHPAPIEERLRESPLIRQAFVVGEGRKFIGALVIPETEQFKRIAVTLNLRCRNEGEILAHAAIHQACQNEINRLLQDFSEPERVKNFVFIDEAALTDPDLITPTQKLRRGMLETKYARQIERVYDVAPLTHESSPALPSDRQR